MAHFYLADEPPAARETSRRRCAEAARADAVGKEIGDPRLQTYAGFTAGWVEASRGNHEPAIAAVPREPRTGAGPGQPRVRVAVSRRTRCSNTATTNRRFSGLDRR